MLPETQTRRAADGTIIREDLPVTRSCYRLLDGRSIMTGMYVIVTGLGNLTPVFHRIWGKVDEPPFLAVSACGRRENRFFPLYGLELRT